MKRIIILLSCFSIQAFALPDYLTEKAEQIPSICQSCFPNVIKWGGKPHCAPAAISNSLVWLAKNGFPSLHPYHGSNELVGQAKLVNDLGLIMETTETAGTTPFKVLTGLKKYLEQRNISPKRIAATGWRSVPAFASLDSPKVKLEWIKEGLLEKGSVWILIGWTKYNSAKDTHQIYDGHWMTVVGYGKNRKGEVDPNIIIVHDPAERSERTNYYASIEELRHGTIDDQISASGVLRIKGDVVLKPGADFGLIQGAYRLEM